jgi:hypothetical protein
MQNIFPKTPIIIGGFKHLTLPVLVVIQLYQGFKLLLLHQDLKV